MHRVLLVEDSSEVQAIIGQVLADDVCALSIASTLADARRLLNESDFSLIILDINLPDGDGFGFCATLRQEASTRDTPIIFLTGKSEITEKVTAFSLGADDFLAKPFHPVELKARVSARLKKIQSQQERNEFVQKGNLRLNTHHLSAVILDSGKELPVDLTAVQFKILLHFAKNEDHVLSREQLITSVRGENIHISDRTIDTHVSNIRKKIARSDYAIQTLYGAGYSFVKRMNGTGKKAA